MDDTRDPISDAHGGPQRHVIVVETNDPHMSTAEMAAAVLDALHENGNHDVVHVSPADGYADLVGLIDEAHENRRTEWDQDRRPEAIRHWGGVAGWLRRKLPAGHPLAYRQHAPGHVIDE